MFSVFLFPFLPRTELFCRIFSNEHYVGQQISLLLKAIMNVKEVCLLGWRLPPRTLYCFVANRSSNIAPFSSILAPQNQNKSLKISFNMKGWNYIWVKLEMYQIIYNCVCCHSRKFWLIEDVLAWFKVPSCAIWFFCLCKLRQNATSFQTHQVLWVKTNFGV